MSDRFEDRDDVAAKVEHEGGVFEALSYGLNADDMPQGDTELLTAWAELDKAYALAELAADRVRSLLDEDESDG